MEPGPLPGAVSRPIARASGLSEGLSPGRSGRAGSEARGSPGPQRLCPGPDPARRPGELPQPPRASNPCVSVPLALMILHRSGKGWGGWGAGGGRGATALLNYVALITKKSLSFLPFARCEARRRAEPSARPGGLPVLRARCCWRWGGLREPGTGPRCGTAAAGIDLSMGGRCAIAIITLNETLPDAAAASSLVCSSSTLTSTPPLSTFWHCPAPGPLPIPAQLRAFSCPSLPGSEAPCPLLAPRLRPPLSSLLDSSPSCPSLPGSGPVTCLKASLAQLDIGHLAPPADHPFRGSSHGPRPLPAGTDRGRGQGRGRSPSRARLGGARPGSRVRGTKGAEGRTPLLSSSSALALTSREFARLYFNELGT